MKHLRVTIDVHDSIGTLIKLQDDFTSSDRQLIAAVSQSLRFTCQSAIIFFIIIIISQDTHEDEGSRIVLYATSDFSLMN